MHCSRKALYAILFFTLSPPGVGQVPDPLTLDDALRRAASNAPVLVRAQGVLEAARAYETRARRRLAENPELELEAGCCRGEDAPDFELSLAQGLDGALRRAARRAAAEAEVLGAEAELEAARREVENATARTFYHALAAEERLALLVRGRELAEELDAVTARREAAGELAVLDAHRATLAAAAARAAEHTAEAERREVFATLGSLVGLAPPFAIRGDLSEAAAAGADPAPPLAARGDLRRLRAELAAAEAEVEEGRALGRPELGLRAGFEREEGVDLARFGVALTLPFRERGREVRAAGESRADSLRRALAAAHAVAEAEVTGLGAVLDERLAALAELEAVVPVLAESERLAGRGFEVGEIGLGELLLVRREILDARLEHLERLLAAALTRLDLRTAEGRSP